MSMIAATAFTTGFAASAALVVAIGAQNAFVLRQGLRREHAALVVGFCFAADAALMAAGVLGLGAALADMPALGRAMAFAGAVYLGAFGLGALRRAAAGGILAAETGGPALSRRGAALRAAGFTLLNPHVYLDTVVLVGALGVAQPDGGRAPFLLGAILASALWFAALGFGSARLAPAFAGPPRGALSTSGWRR
jgi:L-lysine exporter family protein LysE/ArgO